jgi:hypothetical protein
MKAVLKTIASNVVGLLSAAIAVTLYAASHGVDLYAIYDQMNVVFRDVLKLVSMATPFAMIGLNAYRSAPTHRISEISSDPKAVEAVRQMPSTPETSALADALKQ